MARSEGPVVAPVGQPCQRHIGDGEHHCAQRKGALEQRQQPQRCADLLCGGHGRGCLGRSRCCLRVHVRGSSRCACCWRFFLLFFAVRCFCRVFGICLCNSFGFCGLLCAGCGCGQLHRCAGIRACICCTCQRINRRVLALFGTVQRSHRAKVRPVAQHHLPGMHRQARNPAFPAWHQGLGPIPIGAQVALDGKVPACGLADLFIHPRTQRVQVALRQHCQCHQKQRQHTGHHPQRLVPAALGGSRSRVRSGADRG